jgi:hypothetical protein
MNITKAFLTKIFGDHNEPQINKWAESFSFDGLMERDVVDHLDITWQELRRWEGDGRFPASNTFLLDRQQRRFIPTMVMVKGWTVEVVESVRPFIATWREQHALEMKERAKVAKRTKRLVHQLEI